MERNKRFPTINRNSVPTSYTEHSRYYPLSMTPPPTLALTYLTSTQPYPTSPLTLVTLNRIGNEKLPSIMISFVASKLSVRGFPTYIISDFYQRFKINRDQKNILLRERLVKLIKFINTSSLIELSPCLSVIWRCAPKLSAGH